MKSCVLIGLAAVLLAGCSELPDGRYDAPEVSGVEVSVSGNTAILRAELSNERVGSCGFTITDSEGNAIDYPAKLNGLAITAEVRGLRPESNFEVEAWATSGGGEVRSEASSFTTHWYSSPADIVWFEDGNFKAMLTDLYDFDSDGEISFGEASFITRLVFCTNEHNIQSLEGIGAMENLRELVCRGDWVDGNTLSSDFHYLSKHYHWEECIGPIGTLRSLDVSRNTKLEVLVCENNAALGEIQGSLDLTHNTALVSVHTGMTMLPYPDISGLRKLEEINFTHCRGTLRNLSSCPSLRRLQVDYEQTGTLQNIDLSGNPRLEYLHIDGTYIKAIDLSCNPALTYLSVCSTPMTELDVSGNPLLTGDKYIEAGLFLNPSNVRTLYVSAGQEIEGVTVRRSTYHIADDTEIVVR